MMGAAYVMGGANVDIIGRSAAPLVAADSNPGRMSYSFGGVGRNIADNMVRMGSPVSFMTALATDFFGRQVEEACRGIGMDMTYSQRFDGCGMSTYMAIEGPDGDMALAINDMQILDCFDVGRAAKVLAGLGPDDVLVCETNFSRSQLETILQAASCPVYLDPISTVKAVKVAGLLDRLHMIKPNRLEAQALSGLPLQGPDDYVPMLDWFCGQGVDQVVISMGADGVIAAADGCRLAIRPPAVTVVNATGAGDAMLAGMVNAVRLGRGFKESIMMGLAAARIAVLAATTVAADMSPALLAGTTEEIEKESIVTCL